MQSVVTEQAPITSNLPSPFNMHEMLWGSSIKRSRCADQISYPFVRLAFWRESACTTGRRAFGCSDTAMVNMKNSVPWKRCIHPAGSLDWCQRHVQYVENLAVDEKQGPPSCQRFFWGGVPLLVIHPILIVQCHGIVSSCQHFGGGCTPSCHPPHINSTMPWRCVALRRLQLPLQPVFTGEW